MPNTLGHRTQLEAYYNAKRSFLLGVGPDGDSRLKNCHWDRDLVARFACTYYFPPCSTKDTVLPPCRSLCTGESSSFIFILCTWKDSYSTNHFHPMYFQRRLVNHHLHHMRLQRQLFRHHILPVYLERLLFYHYIQSVLYL